MIYKLKGTVEHKLNEALVICLGPVSLEVMVPAQLLSRVAEKEPLELFTHFHLHEKEVALYGFATLEERILFMHLMGISGIGPKKAMSVLSRASVNDIYKAVEKGDAGIFAGAHRIGKKNASRIILELKSKLEKGSDFDLSMLSDDPETEQIVTALIHLGYVKDDAWKAIKEVDRTLPLKPRLKACLKELGKKGD